MPLARIYHFLSVALSLFTAGAVLPAADSGLSSYFQPVNPAAWPVLENRTFVELSGDRPAVAVFTVPEGGAGFFQITDSRFRRDSVRAGRIELGVMVVTAAGVPDSQRPPPAVRATLEAGELFDFDAFLGYLAAGDRVSLTISPADDGADGDRAEIDCRIGRAPLIPVSFFPADFLEPGALRAPGAWSLASNVAAASASVRRLAWGRDLPHGFTLLPSAVRVSPGTIGQESVAAFRVPQSGYYALHDAWLAVQGGAVETRIFVGDEGEPRRAVPVAPASGRVSLNTDLGYIAKGEVISIAFAGSGGTAEFGGSIVEWAPRRAPLRVRRGADGYLDAFEPEAPRTAVDIPAGRWITVSPQAGDATKAIRDALAQARGAQRGSDYVGVRLERGATYPVASNQTGGTVFGFRDTQRLVFDGNGATLRVASAELTRTEVDLFSVAASRNIVFADFIVEATSIPFTTGEILDVSPRGEMTQTVTFRVDPGELDPLKDISRDGRNNAYSYDPRTPGRLAVNSWTHYPGSGTPSIKATDKPGVFTHKVTRTNDSIEPGAKWLIKNKRGGVIYLTTQAGTENVTLSGIDGRAAGGGQLRFWQTSGVNILDSRFEPEGENWISSSADGVHGRGREGVWIENTLIRGICEDVMNTYGQNMVAVPDDDANDAVMSIRMFERSLESTSRRGVRMPTDENVTAGDQLVFFNPQTGRVLGYAGVVSIKNGRFTLTNPVPGVDPWEEKNGRNTTMVYNTRVAGRFFVRDTRFMDSMRIGIYIKARGGVIFGSQFEGLSAPAILGMNEPEWPEGPPPTHVWVQGCTFSQNNYGYMPRHRDYVVVDPADISVYTRHFRDPALPDDFRAFITRGQHANSHLKFIGNVFHDWRGMGIAVRNARNVRIEDNLFLTPAVDDAIRQTFSEDPSLTTDGRGTFAAIFLDTVSDARLAGNRFHGLPKGDREVVQDQDVVALTLVNNAAIATPGVPPTISLSFAEWFGPMSAEAPAIGATADRVELGGAGHRAGKLGGGLYFTGGAPARLVESADLVAEQWAIAFWARPDAGAMETQVVFARGDSKNGAVVAVDHGRWIGGAWNDDKGVWLDLGPAVAGHWQHLALSLGATGVMRGYLDGVEMAAKAAGTLSMGSRKAVHFGGNAVETRLGADRIIPAGQAAYHGGFDEFRFFSRPITSAEDGVLALRRVEASEP